MHLMRHLLKQMRFWDTTSRWAMTSAVILFIILTIIGLTAQPDQRLPFFIGSVGLVVVMQMIVMWGNRHMITPYHAAQRAYLQGDFDSAKQHLLTDIAEHEAQNKSAPVDTLVLLGNLHRQLGDLDQSAHYLQRALHAKPEYHFPLYGYGRTLLAMGQYMPAIDYMQKAMHYGAPLTIQAEIALAYYLAEDAHALQNALADMPALEPYRQLIVDWMAHRAQNKPFVPQTYPPEAYHFWQAEVQRYPTTPYGQALEREIAQIPRTH